MPATYKAVEIKEWGTGDDPVSGIAIVDRPVPTPGAGQVLVRLFLRPINPSDLFSLAGAVAPSRFIAVPTHTHPAFVASSCACLLLFGSERPRLTVPSAISTQSGSRMKCRCRRSVSCAGYYQGFKPDSLPAVPGLEGAEHRYK